MPTVRDEVPTSSNSIPGDFSLLYPWFPLIRKLRSVTARGSFCAVTLRLFIDEHGNPFRLWPEPEVTRLEPGGTAEQNLTDLIEKLTGAKDGKR